MNNKIIESIDGTLVQTDEGFIQVSGIDIKSALDIENYIECLEKEVKKLEKKLNKKDYSKMTILEIIKLKVKNDLNTKNSLLFMQSLTVVAGIIVFFILKVPWVSLSINGESFANIINVLAQIKAIVIALLVASVPFLYLSAGAIVDKYESYINHIELDEFRTLILNNQEELAKIQEFVKTTRPDITEENIVKKEGTVSIPLRTEYSLENEADEAIVRRREIR